MKRQGNVLCPLRISPRKDNGYFSNNQDIYFGEVFKIYKKIDDNNKQDGHQKELEDKKKPENGLYGIEADMSLQSVNFATTENPYLNEHFQEEADD
jgi:hypothetical protein